MYNLEVYNILTKRLLISFEKFDYIKTFLYEPLTKKYFMANVTFFISINAKSLKIDRKVNLSNKLDGNLYSLGSFKNGRILLFGSSMGHYLAYNLTKKSTCFVLKQGCSVFQFRACANENFLISCGDMDYDLMIWDRKKTFNYFVKAYKHKIIHL